MMSQRYIVLLGLIVFSLQSINVHSQETLPDPDGKPADITKPVQVYILLGQSNMLGFGKVTGGDGSLEHAVKDKELYPYLIDDEGNWTTRQDVRNVRVMGSGTGGARQFNNEFLTIKGGRIGPEVGIGHYLGAVTDAPVLLLKSCIGNRSLGWDLLPPGSPSFEYEEKGKKFHYAAYKESPLKWEVGTKAEPINWYAGMQYDGDVARAKQVLKELDKYYPQAKEYEIAGFFWWQGDKDRYNAAHATVYGKNLNQLFKALRKEFNAPKAKMVVATLGQTNKDTASGNEKMIIDGMFAFGEAHKGEAAVVYTNPISMGSSSNAHYGGNAKTYMNVGLGMGKAMVELLSAGKK